MYVVLKLLTPAILDIGSFEGIYDVPEAAIERAELLQKVFPLAAVVIHTCHMNSLATSVLVVYDPVKPTTV